MTWDEEYDVVSAGSGIGGLSFALTASESGLTSIVVEKFEFLGGVAALSSGQLWVGPNHLAEEAGIKDSPEEAKKYIDHLSQGLSSVELRDNYFSRSREALRFFADKIGLEFMVINDLPDYYYPAVPGSAPQGRYVEIKPFPAAQLGEYAKKILTSPFGAGYSYVTSVDFVNMSVNGGESVVSSLQQHIANDERCAGAGLAAAQVQAALKRGIKLETSTSVVELVVEDGRVSGVVVENASGKRRIRARKGVMLATGGYDWRRDFVKSFDALAESGSMALPTITGDHIVLASKVGAIPLSSRAPAQTPIFIGYRVPTETIYGKPCSRLLTPGHPHSIVVNKSGKRFANDAFYPDVATKCGRFDGQEDGMANWPAYLIFDQNMLDKYGLLPSYPGQPLPEGLATKADTLGELAIKTGINVDQLLATVERFNGFCKSESQVDPDWARGTVPWGRVMTGDPSLKNPNLADIARSPFYAVKLERVTMGVPTAGLPISTDGAVLDAAGAVVPGLYASGNSAAWQDWAGGYNSGIAMMRGMLYGYLAALDIAKTTK